GIDVWVYDLSGTASIRKLTFSGTNAYPLWSLDGQRIVFESGQERNKGLYWQRADGSDPAERLTTAANDADQIPLSWTPDGKTLLFAESGGLWTVSLAGDRKPIRVIEKAGMFAAGFSPDGRWIAYSASPASPGRTDIYVEPYPPTGSKNVISP